MNLLHRDFVVDSILWYIVFSGCKEATKKKQCQ